jgi:aspartokinase
MSITPADFGEKIRINGIKLSAELVQVNLLGHSLQQDFRVLFFRFLAQHQINIPFILVTGMAEKIQGSCCVAAKDANRVKKLVAMEPELKENVEFISGVGALSMFPHHSKLKLLGLSFYLFGETRLPVHAMSSSISSLTFIMDYPKLDNAVSTLLEYVDLPPNHAPFRPEIHVIQQKR